MAPRYRFFDRPPNVATYYKPCSSPCLLQMASEPRGSFNPGCRWIPDLEPVFGTVEEYCDHRSSCPSFGPPSTGTVKCGI